jgi:hypothetical protein
MGPMGRAFLGNVLAAVLVMIVLVSAGCAKVWGIDDGLPYPDGSAEGSTGDDAADGQSAEGAGGDGMACEAGATCTPTYVCHLGTLSCSGSGSTCEDTGVAKSNGTPCDTDSGTGMVCYDGTCISCNQGQTCMTTNVCHLGAIDCSTGMPVCVDTGTTLPNGTSCGMSDVCETGACVPCVTGAACTPASNACDTAAPTP